MKIPIGMTEEEVIRIVTKALNGLCAKFRFGYFETEDMEQEGWIFAMEALEKYDGTHPLENFLRVSLRRKFINLRRNKFSRFDPPCQKCPFFDPECKLSKNKCSEFEDKNNCDKWSSYTKRNATKSELVRPLNIDSITEDNLEINKEFFNSINLAEIYKKIDDNMPTDLRTDFLRLLDGMYLPKNRKDRVREFLTDLGIIDELRDWEDK